MVDFSTELINQIKNADDVAQLRKLIDGFVQNPHAKNIGGAGCQKEIYDEYDYAASVYTRRRIK